MGLREYLPLTLDLSDTQQLMIHYSITDDHLSRVWNQRYTLAYCLVTWAGHGIAESTASLCLAGCRERGAESHLTSTLERVSVYAHTAAHSIHCLLTVGQGQCWAYRLLL